MANELIHPDPAGMSADEHIAEAARLLTILGVGIVGQAVDRAQVHAALAVAKQLRAQGRENVRPGA